MAIESVATPIRSSIEKRVFDKMFPGAVGEGGKVDLNQVLRDSLYNAHGLLEAMNTECFGDSYTTALAIDAASRHVRAGLGVLEFIERNGWPTTSEISGEGSI